MLKISILPIMMFWEELVVKIKRGDIIIADLGQHETSIQSGIRPCVVRSNDIDRKSVV